MKPAREWLEVARLFDFLDDVVAWIKDRDGRYCWVNRAFVLNLEARAAGASCSDSAASVVIGRTDYDLSPPYLADQFRLDDEQVLTGQPVINRIELVGELDGLAVWHVTNKIPLRNRFGRIIGTAGTTRALQASAASGGPSGLESVLGYLRDHYATAVTNEELAAFVHMSTRSFERNFVKTFHLTPQQYLRKLRMRMASRTLVFTQLPLAEVAQACGFSDQSHFAREFRRQFGRTPREYRERFAVGNET